MILNPLFADVFEKKIHNELYFQLFGSSIIHDDIYSLEVVYGRLVLYNKLGKAPPNVDSEGRISFSFTEKAYFFFTRVVTYDVFYLCQTGEKNQFFIFLKKENCYTVFTKIKLVLKKKKSKY